MEKLKSKALFRRGTVLVPDRSQKGYDLQNIAYIVIRDNGTYDKREHGPITDLIYQVDRFDSGFRFIQGSVHENQRHMDSYYKIHTGMTLKLIREEIKKNGK